ncbi:hypothetical protein IMF27_30695 [Pseudomonas sp. PCH199]|nr:hypothetical protein [Pseudomonas sp. PCH199]
MALRRTLRTRGIREASTLFSFGHAGAYDHEDDVMYLTAADVRMVDVGDADIVHTIWSPVTRTPNTPCAKSSMPASCRWYSWRSFGARAGDQGIEGRGPIHIIHFDAHLDFVR